MGGRRQLHAVVDSMPQSAGVAHFEGSTLTDPTASTAFQPELISRSMYVRLRWTGEVEDAARTGDKAVFAGPRANELRLARQQYAVNKCRMAVFGPRQILGKISSVSGTGPYTLTMEGRNAKTSLAIDYYKMGAHYIRKNMLVDCVTATNGSPVDAGSTNSGSRNKGDCGSGNVLRSSKLVLTLRILRQLTLIPHGSRRDDGGVTTATDASFYGYNGLDNLMLDTNIYNAGMVWLEVRPIQR